MESCASSALKEFRKLVSILVHMANPRAKNASKFDPVERHSRTGSLAEKLNFISCADGFEELGDPLEILRDKLQWIKQSSSSVKDV